MSNEEPQEDQGLAIALTPKQLGIVAVILILVIILRRCCKTS